jgi:hypothetical protein
MTMSYLFRARLRFRDAAAIEAAKAELAEEGCLHHPDNLLTGEDLRWNGLELVVDTDGSMPYSCFEISTDVLAVYARHASSGEAIAANTEDGVGERFPAGGGEPEELEGAAIDALRSG